MEVRSVDIWKERGCNECGSTNEVKELVIGGNGKRRGSASVIALCKECRNDLYYKLQEDVFN